MCMQRNRLIPTSIWVMGGGFVGCWSVKSPIGERVNGLILIWFDPISSMRPDILLGIQDPTLDIKFSIWRGRIYGIHVQNKDHLTTEFIICSSTLNPVIYLAPWISGDRIPYHFNIRSTSSAVCSEITCALYIMPTNIESDELSSTMDIRWPDIQTI